MRCFVGYSTAYFNYKIDKVNGVGLRLSVMSAPNKLSARANSELYLTGFTDEAADELSRQIAVCRHLGWSRIDLRTVDGGNIVEIPDTEFDEVCKKLAEAGLEVSSFGSRIANWSRRVDDDPDADYRLLEAAIPRMHRLGVKYIRIMSYRPDSAAGLSAAELERRVVERVRTLAKMAEAGGVICLHENCDTWGGQSHEHTLRLLDAVGSEHLKLVFDTGNPFATLDVRGEVPYRFQDTWEFYERVKPHIAYLHIKDGVVADGQVVYTFPGEGNAEVPRILADLAASGYQGPISIEPHLAVVYHDPSVTAGSEERWDSFVAYAKRTGRLLKQAGFELTTP